MYEYLMAITLRVIRSCNAVFRILGVTPVFPLCIRSGCGPSRIRVPVFPVVEGVPHVRFPYLAGEGEKIVDGSEHAQAAGTHPEQTRWYLPQIKPVESQGAAA